MLSSINVTMKPLLESANGIHLTAYLKNRGEYSDLRSQALDALNLAKKHLAPVMSSDEIKNFLEPLVRFADDGRQLKNFKGSIGIFRNESSFRALSLPLDVEPSCIVADTFHVKPLLKWMQVDREFLLLGLETGSASLYQGDLYGLRHIDTVLYPESLRNLEKGLSLEGLSTYSVQRKKLLETMEWLNGWIMNLTTVVRPRLFIAGKSELTRPLLQILEYENASLLPIRAAFTQQKSVEIAAQIRMILNADAKKTFEKALQEFHYAVDMKQAKGNVFAIAKAAVTGKIRKLLIADGIQIFGKLNRKNGELKINGKDLDHEDDDILDDIAQAVLANGGEVTVAARGQIPAGRPILAIIDDPTQSHLSQIKDFDSASETFKEEGLL